MIKEKQTEVTSIIPCAMIRFEYGGHVLALLNHLTTMLELLAFMYTCGLRFIGLGCMLSSFCYSRLRWDHNFVFNFFFFFGHLVLLLTPDPGNLDISLPDHWTKKKKQMDQVGPPCCPIVKKTLKKQVWLRSTMRGGRASWLRTGGERTRNFKWPVIKKNGYCKPSTCSQIMLTSVCVFYSAGLVCARVWTVVGPCNL